MGDLSEAHLEKANLLGAHLERTDLSRTWLTETNLSGAQLVETFFAEARLAKANLRGAKLEAVNLGGITLANEQGVGPVMVDASWPGTNLSVVSWPEMVMLGDEHCARQKNDRFGKKGRGTRLDEYQDAMRATHQLTVALQDQGLIADASRFAYRAKCLERTVRWYELWTISWYEQDSWGNSRKKTAKSIRKGLIRFFSIAPSWLFSWFLFLIAGYGYRLRYCLFWYLFFIVGFTIAYLIVEPHYFIWWTALGESVNVFHGRGASPNVPELTHPARFALLTVLEAWTGLMIEVVLVATLIQRFFGK